MHLAVLLISSTRVCDGDGVQKLPCIRMLWRLEYGTAGAQFNNAATPHDRNLMRYAFDHRHVVRNEKIGNIQPLLQLYQEINDLGLN